MEPESYRLAIPGMGTFGPELRSLASACAIAQEVANEQNSPVEIIDRISIAEIREPQTDG